MVSLTKLTTRSFFFNHARRNLVVALLTLSVGLSVLSNARGQTPNSDPFAEFRARIEQVERENRELRQVLMGARAAEQTASADLPPSAEIFPALAPGVDGGDSSGPMDESRIRGIIENFYREREAIKKKADEKKAEEDAIKNKLKFNAAWKDGINFATSDNAFKVHIGGRTQFDTVFFGVDSPVQNDPKLVNKYGDGVDFRRARLRMDGTIYEWIEYAAEYDFMNSVRDGANVKAVPAPTDLWWAFTKLPIGNIRVGNQKEAIGFEHAVSSRFLPFMERSFGQDAFYGGFNNGFTPGISWYDYEFDEMMTWNIGLYKPTDNVFVQSVNNGDYAVTGRLTYLPYYECDGTELIHIGGSARAATTFHDSIRFRTRGPERSGLSQNWPLPGDTGTFFGRNTYMLNGEVAAIFHRWTVQSEYTADFTTDARKAAAGPVLGTTFYQNCYVQVLYYLTDDHDTYSKHRASFDRVTPKENARPGCSIWQPVCGGAWQVGVRYNYLDLNSVGINGGVLNDVTAGLNWYLNPNLKLQWNYSATHRESPTGAGDGWIHGFGMRVAHDF